MILTFTPKKSYSAFILPKRQARGLVLGLALLTGLLGSPGAQAQTGMAARALPPTHGPIIRPLTGRPALAQVQQVLRQELALTPDDYLRLLRTETDEMGGVHERFQQYYRGVKVEHGVVSAHALAGRIESVSGELERMAAMPAVQPALSEAAALHRAKRAVGARVYKWELPGEERALKTMTANPRATYVPKGELVLVGDFRQPAASRPLVLAWKFNIYAHQPTSRELIYVDARSGQVVLRDAIIKHLNVTGTGDTRYLGPRPVFADQFGGGYRLRESVHGKGVVTLNARKTTNYGTAVDFVDNDNNWTAAEFNNANFDNAALDAHIGAQVTQDYWTTVHGRDSFDDKGTVLTSYVHYDVNLENAFWNGTNMSYGDGGTRFRPLTALDVCGHEIGHAVCETTAGLVYANESGAMNEGFSDIWGACVENHLDPTKQIWLIGEDIDKQQVALRSMSNPGSLGQPDTYKGANWAPLAATPTSANDQGGVHTNSGVLNFWFYLLSAGGSGTNDNGTAYAVTGITISKAARIAYRTERFYLTPNATYSSARQASLQAAVDLFGLGSAEVQAVARAWRAVGVEQTEAAPTITSFAPTSGLVGQSVTLTGTNFGSLYSVRFNGAEATQATYTSLTSVTVKVPAGATTGALTVTTATGVVSTGTSFTVTSPGPAPTLTSYVPAAGAAQGGGVTLTGTNFTGAMGVTFNGSAASFTVVNATTITTTVPAGATSGTLTVTTAGGSASKSFTVLPALTSFSPTSGPAGTSVTIIGTSLTGALSVKFNGIYATAFAVVNATTITTQVPLGATTGPLTVRTPDGTATGPIDFTVSPGLVFDSFTPARGPVGTVVTLSGQGFSGTTAVAINGTAVTAYTVASDNEIWATVPAGARSGFITLTSPQGSGTSARMFEVTVAAGGPAISSFTPTSGPVGTSVTINGSNFSGATGATFNGTAATTFNVVNASRITATVPAGATSGPISVATPTATGLSTTDFYVTPANDQCANAITVACGSVTAGTTLGSTHTGDPSTTCTGTGAGATFTATTLGVFYKFVGVGGSVTMNTCANATYDGQIAVYTGSCGTFTCVGGDDDGCGQGGGGSTVTFNSVLGTTYYLYVSGYGTGAGNFTLTVSCANMPAISSFTPGSGPSSTSVALTGTNFTGATAVRFNGVTAGFTLNSATSITTAVPAGATTGPITVVTPGGTGVSATFFTVPAPTISAFTLGSGPAGTSVVLTGTYFTGATAVRFNGVNAASFTVNSAAQIMATVPVGATTGPISVVAVGGTGTSASSFEVLAVFTGTYNQCLSTTPISSTGSGTWQWLRAGNGQLVAALNDQGNVLGQVSAEFYLNQGAVRADSRGREYLDRNWHLLAQNTFTGQSVLVRFYAPNAEFATYVAANDGDGSDVTTLAQLRITQYQGPNEDCQLSNNSGPNSRLLTPSGQEALAGASWFALETAVPDHFSEFYLNGGGQPLPVELTAFSARHQGRPVQLAWATAQELQNQGFVLERSADGRAFAAVTGLIAGAGTTTTPRSYSYLDEQAPEGRAYYRLRQLDTNGSARYSPVVTVAAVAAAALSCYPQPAHTSVAVVGASPGAAVTLFDALGRAVTSATAGTDGAATLRLPAGLATGVYIVRSGNVATRLAVE